MTPTLVTPPATLPVTLAEAKAHCRVDGDYDDVVLTSLVAAAVGHLDGWTGVLGRCIVSQTWRVQAVAGDVVLPMPDVTAAIAGYAAGASDLTITATAGGPQVTITEDCAITFTCAMPDHLQAAVKVAVLLLVGHWYANREAVGAAMAETPMTVQMLVDQMRWVRL